MIKVPLRVLFSPPALEHIALLWLGLTHETSYLCFSEERGSSIVRTPLLKYDWSPEAFHDFIS